MIYRITASGGCDHEMVTADTLRDAFRVADALEEYYPDREVKIEEIQIELSELGGEPSV